MKFNEKIVSILKETKANKILINVSNFTFFQLTNYLVPLLTIPYIVRIISAEKFGIISFIQAVIYYLFVIVDYGFDISGTQKVAQERDSQEKLNQIFSSILIIKTVLMVLAFLILVFLSYLFSEIKEHFLIYIFAFMLIPAQILLSLWFYTAMEKTKYLNYVNLVNKVLYLVGIFVFISVAEDYYLIPAIHSGSFLIAGMFSLYFIFKDFKIKLRIPNFSNIVSNLKEGWHVFVSNLSITLYRNSNVVILGLFAPKEIVGIYSAGEKIIKLLQSIFIPINKVMYPYISREKVKNPNKSISYIRKMVVSLGIITFILSILLIFLAKPFSLFFLGKNFITTSYIIQISAFVIFFSMYNYIIGIIYMLNFNMKEFFLKSVIFTGLANIFLCTILSYYMKEIGTAIAFLSSEIILTILISYYLITLKLRKSIWTGYE